MAEIQTESGTTMIAGELALARGGSVRDPQVAWEVAGPSDAPLIAAMGGISANRHVTSASEPGWWKDFAGPGLGLDTHRYRVLGIDFLGGNGDTTGPRNQAQDLPAIDPIDQANLLARLLEQMEWPSLRAYFGASYGGMVALHFAALHPERLQELVVIGAAHRAPGIATALRTIQREAIRACESLGDTATGLRIARAIGMVTYRSEQEFDVRFDRKPDLGGGHAKFDVENYLFSRGDEFARRFHPKAVLTLSESIDLQEIDPASIGTPTELFCAETDFVAPVSLMTELRDRLSGPCRYTQFPSLFGHDAFLKETALLNEHFRRILDREAPAT